VIWAFTVLACMASVVISCYTATAGGPDVYAELVVWNRSGVIATVRDQNGTPLGKVTSGVQRLKIRRPTHGMQYFVISVTSGGTYATWPENISSRDCWEVEIDFMNPEHSVLTTFQPCVSDWAVRNRTIQAYSVGHSQDTLWRYQIRGEHSIPDPTIHRLLWLMTANCLGFPPNDVMAVRWKQAAAIIRLPGEGEENGQWIQGLWLADEEAGPGTILLDEAFVFDVPTVTHEAIHSITHLGDGEPAFEVIREKCEFRHNMGG